MLICSIYGFIALPELSELSVLIKIFVIFLPTSAKLHADANWESLIRRGGNNTLYVGSLSKQIVMVGVVKLWIIG